MNRIFKSPINAEKLLNKKIRRKARSSRSEADFNFIPKSRSLLKKKSRKSSKNLPKLYKKPAGDFNFENTNPALICSYLKLKKPKEKRSSKPDWSHKSTFNAHKKTSRPTRSCNLLKFWTFNNKTRRLLRKTGKK